MTNTKKQPKEKIYFVEDDLIARDSIRVSVQNKMKSGKIPNFINKILERY